MQFVMNVGLWIINLTIMQSLIAIHEPQAQFMAKSRVGVLKKFQKIFRGVAAIANS